MGFPVFAAVFAVIMCLASLLLTAVNFGGRRDEDRRKILKITVPEDLDYTGIFDDLMTNYTSSHRLTGVKTTNLGSLFELRYTVTLRDVKLEKEMLDQIRQRNGNLNITCSRSASNKEEL